MFDRFAEAIARLSETGPTERELEQFLLEQDDQTRIYYAPFDHVNANAKVVILGITPGRDSMMNAFRAATAALRRGESQEEALRFAKEAGSFSNMRYKIAEMLDGIGLHRSFGISSCTELFGTRCDLLHPTSCIRYPVFSWDKKKNVWANYTGYRPKMIRWRRSFEYMEQYLTPELQRLNPALIVPCGEAVDGMLRHMAHSSLVDDQRCLFGFPHASGANGHKDAFFAARKQQLQEKVATWSRSYLSPVAPSRA